MKISDRIYGDFEINDPVIEAIVESPAFQRLKRVNQYGGVDLVFPDRYQVTRFEHSLGVWHILRTLGASRQIQVAGLLHDIGHTAFSHMVDMALASSGEDYHEKNMHLIAGLDEIDRILHKNGIKLLEADECPEIKKSLPDVGADRVDYAVRDFVGATNTRAELGEKVLNSITLSGRNIIFTDPAVAREFALVGLQAMWLCIYEPSVACVYQALTEIIRKGFDQKWINENNLFDDDAALFEIIKQNRDKLPEVHFKLFTTPFEVEEVTEAEHDFNHIKLKVRYFDPGVLVNDQVKRLSEIDPVFVRELEPMKQKFEERKQGKFFKVNFS